MINFSGFLVCLGLLLSLASCSLHPTTTIPPLNQSSDLSIDCETIYPQGQWQFVHSLTFALANGSKGTAIGVSVLDEPTIKSALMTIEGFVLFEAVLDKEIEIIRAVSPFDNEEFAKGLMRDLQLIFFKPHSNKIQYGKLDNGSPLCRYHETLEQSTDVVLFDDQGWEINQYGSNRQKTRAIKASPPININPDNQWQPPSNIVLHANDFAEYTISMALISSEKL